MFYKKENDMWFVGSIIVLPTDPPTILNENNKNNDYGWVWHDNTPQEYLDWKESNELENQKNDGFSDN